MASSGSLLSNGWYSSSKGDYIYLEFAWSVSSTSIAENYKDIYWELRGKRTASGYVKSGGFQVVIDGETVYDKSTDYRIELRNGTVVASGTKRLWHNSDGTRSFPVHIEGAIYWDNKNVSGDATFYLDTIPRQATITAAPDFTDMDNPTITYSNPAGDAVTTLDACISFTGERDDIAYRAIPKTWSSYQFPLTEAERNVLRSNTTGPSRTVTFFVRSVIGGVTYWSTIPKTLYIADSEATRPTVSMTLSPVNNLGAKFNGLYIQGKSKVKAELKIDLKYGATEDAVGVNVEGVDYGTPYESGYLKHSGNQVVKSAVRDSRGIYGTHDVGIYVIAYSKPLVVPLSGENVLQKRRKRKQNRQQYISVDQSRKILL